MSSRNRSPNATASTLASGSDANACAMRRSYSSFVHPTGISTSTSGIPIASTCRMSSERRTPCIEIRS